MAFPSYTYTLTNGTTADASQVMQNFNDLLNGISDATKDISVNNVTAAGTATLSGSVVLGNGTIKTITFNGSLASSIPISTNTSFDFGTATLGLKSVYIGGTSTFTTRVMSAASASWTLTLPATAGTASFFLQTDGSGNAAWASPSGAALTTQAKSTTYLALNTDSVIFCSGASWTLTLYDASLAANKGKTIQIIHQGTSLTQAYTLATTSAQTIGGIASSLYILQTNGESLTLVSDGANWQILDHVTLNVPQTWTPQFGYTFTVTSANATVGATYTNNGQTFTVLSTIAASTTLRMYGTGAPAASGTLTKASGTGDATIAFSAGPASLGIITSLSAWWTRRGNVMRGYGSFNPGTATANIFFMSIPGGAVLDTTVIAPSGNTTASQGMLVGTFQASGGAGGVYNLVLAPGSSTVALFNANITSGSTPLTPQSTNTGITSGSLVSFVFEIAILGWQP